MTEETAKNPLSVSEALSFAKGALESVTVRLVGEVSEFSHKPGYKAVYFTVKDEGASLPCMIWNNRYEKSGVEMFVGQLVELTGRFTLYAAKGRMNFEVFSIAAAGEGNLRLQVAQLAQKLKAEGLMDAQQKLPVPTYPLTIGLVTSPRGDAVHDVLRTLRRRFPVARVVLAGVAVEGAKAAEGIIEGLRCMYRAQVEVILLVRGGGSFEDLMPFNDESLARAIVKCPIPVVTGIGHEPDNSIADMVADRRCSTPTAAAEAVSPARESLATLLDSRMRSLEVGVQRRIDSATSKVEQVASRPLFTDSNLLLSQSSLGLDLAADRLQGALPTYLEKTNESLQIQKERLNRAIPNNVARDSVRYKVLSERFLRALPLACEAHNQEVQKQHENLVRLGTCLTNPFTQRARLGAARLNDLSPLAILGRGYTMTKNEEGRIVHSIHDVSINSVVEVTVSDGVLACSVNSTKEQALMTAQWEEGR